MELLVLLFAASVVINGAMFVVAYKLQSDKLTDASYAVTFIVLALIAQFFSPGQTLHWLVTAMVGIWALRIGGFLLYRVVKVGKDRRFDGIREHFWQFGKFWAGQALSVWVLMLPIGLLSNETTSLAPLSMIGIALWAIGVIIESVADAQKYAFHENPANKGKWIESGIWRYSRHPNYFGEILVWVGVYVTVVPALTGASALIGLVSPIFIAALLLFVSGVPPLEKSADKRWGNDPAYKRYKQSTSLIVPLPKQK